MVSLDISEQLHTYLQTQAQTADVTVNDWLEQHFLAAASHPAPPTQQTVHPALHDRELRYQHLVAHLPDVAVMLYDHDLRYILVDGAEIENSRFSKTALEGKLIRETLPKDFYSEVEPYLRAALQGQSQQVELPFNEKLFYRLNYVPVYDTDRTIMYGMIVAWNITDQKAAEKDHEQAQLRYQALFDQSHDGIFIMSLEGHVLDCNRRGMDMLGYTRKEIINMGYEQIVVSAELPKTEAVIAQINQNKRVSLRYERRLRHKDGTEFPVYVRVEPVQNAVGELTHFQSVIQDITDLKAAERDREQAQLRYQALFDQSHDGIFIIDLTGTIVDCNEYGAMMLGYTRTEFIGTSYHLGIASEDIAHSKSIIDRLIHHETPALYERTMRHKDGTCFPVEIRSIPVHNSDGEVIYLQTLVHNIQERKQIEAALRESEARYRALFEQSHDGILLMDMNGIYFDCNQAIVNMTGYTRDEIVGAFYHMLAVPHELAQSNAVFDNLQQGNVPPLYERGLRRKDGTEFTVEMRVEPIRDTAGEFKHIQSVVRDISERKHAEAALRESEARYRTIVEHFPGGVIALYDHDLRYTFIGGQGLIQPGMTAADLTMTRIQDSVPPELYERYKPVLDAGLAGDMAELTVLFEDEYYHVITLPVVDENGTILSGMILSQNVTDLKRAEERQKELIEQLELAIDTANLGIWHLDTRTDIVTWNQQLYEIFGTDHETRQQNKDIWQQSIHPDDLEYATHHLELLTQTRQSIKTQFRIIRPDGEIRYIQATGAAGFDDNGNIIRVTGINLDVTDYERARRDLEASEARYRVLFDNTIYPIVVYDEEARIVMINSAGATNLNSTPNKVIGTLLREHIPELHDVTVQRIQQVLVSQQPMEVEDAISLAGQTRWFHTLIQEVVVENYPLRTAQFISVEITARKRAEALETERADLAQQLVQEQARAEERSRMLSILSHELRTPLTIMQNAADMLSRYFERLNPAQREARLQRIRNQIYHLDGMLEEISAISTNQNGFMTYHPAPVDVAQLCEMVIQKMQDYTGHSHTLRLQITPDLPPAIIDEKLMNHALTNLLSNAIKYSSPGDTIDLHVSFDDDTWQFAISDPGIGIPASEQADLFIPFRRASNIGEIRGTGLGLYIVKEVAERHKGYVIMNSQLNAGSTFTIIIPNSQESVHGSGSGR